MAQPIIEVNDKNSIFEVEASLLRADEKQIEINVKGAFGYTAQKNIDELNKNRKKDGKEPVDIPTKLPDVSVKVTFYPQGNKENEEEITDYLNDRFTMLSVKKEEANNIVFFNHDLKISNKHSQTMELEKVEKIVLTFFE